MQNNNDILLIGDYHAHPNYDNDRAGYIGRVIRDYRPGTILQIGDLGDMPSLSSYDSGTRNYEGRRYSRDIEAAVEAEHRMFLPIREINRGLARRHKPRYNPRRIITLGNHDERVDRAVNLDSKLEGTINFSRDAQLGDYWTDVVAFKESINVNGILASHYFATGVSGRPVSGESAALALLKKNFVSSIAGHSHLLDIAYRTRADGTKMVGIVAGCFAHPKMIEGWNRDTVRMWWYGLIYLRNVVNGSPSSVECISLKELEYRYGKKT